MQTIPLLILPPVTERASGGTAYGAAPTIGAVVYAQMNPPAPAEGRYGLTLAISLTLRIA